jgi:hypothetical protein
MPSPWARALLTNPEEKTMLEAEERAQALASIKRQSHERVARQLDVIANVFGTDRDVIAAIVDGAQEAVMGWLPKPQPIPALKGQQAARGEVQSDPATTTTLGSRARIGDVWTYRTRATYVPDEDNVEDAIRREAASIVPEALATITILSVKRTPTGRWSAIVKRTRIALTEGDL